MADLQRREILSGVTAASIGGMAGCVGSSKPEMEFEKFIVPDPRATSATVDESEYSGTIHNSREKGNIRVELWYFRDQTVPNPRVPYPFQETPNLNRSFDVGRSFYFSEDERREISIAATNKQHPQWDQIEFGIIPFPASHGAIFKNTGSAGEIELRLEYRDTQGYDVEEPPRKLETVGEDNEIEASFEVLIPTDVEYEIVAEPV